MEHLTALDAAFLEVEDSDPHVSLAVGGVSIIEGPAPSYDEFVATFAERVPTIPRCRQVLRRRESRTGWQGWRRPAAPLDASAYRQAGNPFASPTNSEKKHVG
jgi:hypothetical protein